MAPTPKQGENLRRLRNSPVCIICGRPGEAEAIARALGIYENRLRSHEVAEIPNDHTFYYGHFELSDGTQLGYVVTSSTRQGIQSFTTQAAVLAHTLRPRFMVHAGVCAGKRSGKIQLGDVIFGEAAFNFEEGKFKVGEDGQVVFVPDYNLVSVRTGDMQAFADDHAQPGYHYGDYITGSAVRQDAPLIFERIGSQVGRNVIALDMEASAFLELCNYFSKDVICLGVVKGVSDLGDEQKGNDPAQKKLALVNTAKALRDWIINSIPAKTWEDDYSREPAAEIMAVYYDNFVRRVLDNVSQGLPVMRKRVQNQVDHTPSLPILDIKGLKIVMPKDDNPVEYAGLGPISSICKKHDILEVEVGGDHGKRGLYYKAGYLIDWPRAINRYAESYDAKHQVMVFRELLKKKEWFHVGSDSLRASIVSWEEMTTWLEKNPTPILHEEPEPKEPVYTVTRVERSPSPLQMSGRGRKPKPFKRGLGLDWLKKSTSVPVPLP